VLKERARGFVAGLVGLVAGPSLAHAGAPEPWQIGFQPAASPIMAAVESFSNGLLIVVTLITVFVLALLVYVMVRFNARANPIPSRTTHNTLIEVLWTVVPILILVGIAVPSFSLLFATHDPARAIAGFDPARDRTMTIKATGNQWYWSYEYPDNGGISFDSNMLQNNQRGPNDLRLLAVDNQLIVPTGVVIRMQVIGAEVIHAFAVPAFGVKIDAVPGRLNETWFRVDREGVYYGQCSELCGQAPSGDPNDLHGHAFMPIAVRAVSPSVFDAWARTAATDLGAAYQQLAGGPARPSTTPAAPATTPAAPATSAPAAPATSPAVPSVPAVPAR
jgi:cytochrome c oxidase subunit 2